MFGLGFGELAIILVLVVLVFGGKRLPQLGSGLAKGIKNFKKGLNDEDSSESQQATQKEKQKEEIES